MSPKPPSRLWGVLGVVASATAVIVALFAVVLGCLVAHVQKTSRRLLVDECIDDHASYIQPQAACTAADLQRYASEKPCEGDLECLQSKSYVVLKSFLSSS